MKRHDIIALLSIAAIFSFFLYVVFGNEEFEIDTTPLYRPYPPLILYGDSCVYIKLNGESTFHKLGTYPYSEMMNLLLDKPKGIKP